MVSFVYLPKFKIPNNALKQSNTFQTETTHKSALPLRLERLISSSSTRGERLKTPLGYQLNINSLNKFSSARIVKWGLNPQYQASRLFNVNIAIMTSLRTYL
jgi:hypothetical protein